jgi:hypothetical protein
MSTAKKKAATTKRREDDDEMPEIDLRNPRWKVLGRGLRAGRARFELRLLRESLGKTQADIATATGIDPADVSKLEHRESLDTVQVSTVRRYAKALGGGVELVIVIGGRRYVLAG